MTGKNPAKGAKAPLECAVNVIDVDEVPVGSPPWVTAGLIHETVRVWQRYYAAPLTPDDALYILLNAGRLMDVLAEGTLGEKQ